MKIQDLQIWQNGQLRTANNFIIITNYDNMENSANFSYQLQNVSEVQQGEIAVNTITDTLINGSLVISGQDYQDWDVSPSANQWAYDWAAAQLNLVLIPESV